MQNEADARQETATRPMLVFTGALHANDCRAEAGTPLVPSTASVTESPVAVPAALRPRVAPIPGHIGRWAGGWRR